MQIVQTLPQVIAAATLTYLNKFQVISEALVTRVIFDEPVSQDLVATGAEFLHGGMTYVALCGKEVVLSAGWVPWLSSCSNG